LSQIMRHQPLTFFTALSVAAHAAMFGLWSEPMQELPTKQESAIEIGLVLLPRIDKDYTHDFSRPQSRPLLDQAPKEETEQTTALSHKPPSSDVANNSAPVGKLKERLSTRKFEQKQEITSSLPLTDSSPTNTGSNPASATVAAPIRSNNPAPSYPADALRYGWEGEVWLIVNVNRNGSVSNVTVDKSSGYSVLDRAAKKTVRKWQFEPARVGSETVEGTVRIPIHFRIKRA